MGSRMAFVHIPSSIWLNILYVSDFTYFMITKYIINKSLNQQQSVNVRV